MTSSSLTSHKHDTGFLRQTVSKVKSLLLEPGCWSLARCSSRRWVIPSRRDVFNQAPYSFISDTGFLSWGGTIQKTDRRFFDSMCVCGSSVCCPPAALSIKSLKHEVICDLNQPLTCMQKLKISSVTAHCPVMTANEHQFEKQPPAMGRSESDWVALRDVTLQVSKLVLSQVKVYFYSTEVKPKQNLSAPLLALYISLLHPFFLNTNVFFYTAGSSLAVSHCEKMIIAFER